MENRLISVLVVDDELLIRQELEMFSWEEYGYRLIGTARNAKEALKICREEIPDIVITDITMPVMNGLDLIKELTVRYPAVKTLILTCHEDFGYVKEAIGLGAVDYVLKLDMTEQPMIKALEKAKKLVEEECTQKQTEKEQLRDRITGKLILSKGQKEIPVEEIAKMLEEIHFPIKYFQGNYFLMIENRIESWVFVRVIFQEIFRSQQIVDNWFVFDDNCYAISFREENWDNVQRFIAFLNQIISERFTFMKPHFYFYVVKARPVRNLKEYCRAFDRVEEWRNWHFYYPENTYIDEEDVLVMREVSEEDFMWLEETSTGEKVPAFARVFAQIPPMRLKELIIRLMQKKGMDAKVFYEEIFSTGNVHELEILFERIFRENADQKFRIEIRQALKLIREEYAQNLTLASVAECVHLSPQYLSRLFGETVGRNFNDYIMDVRMENAKRLIHESNYRIYQVAEMVGIPNYRYFSTIFKKYYGVSPKEMATGKYQNEE